MPADDGARGRVRLDRTGDGTSLRIEGDLTITTVPTIRPPLMRALRDGASTIHLDQLADCDGAGLALIYEMTAAHGATLSGLDPKFNAYLDQFHGKEFPSTPGHPGGPRGRPGPIASLGQAAAAWAGDLRELLVFTGRLTIVLARGLARPSTIRWQDTFATMERAGADALLIVGMIGFLTGMIMAFQSAVPMRQFGADIFVVNLVAISMLRELGVLMTAIVLAGRSGSAFAAEIGTMIVNEEVDALRTMGMDPVRLLVLPKVLAALAVTPLLAMYANVIGVAGGLLVVMLLGHPLAAVWRQLLGAVDAGDLLSGLIKAAVFGLVVAAVGCLRGLQTRSGAAAVGHSTTRAVVSGIFLIVLLDGVFSIVFYAIGF